MPSRLNTEKISLLIVRLGLGVFFFFEGWDKLQWMRHPELLTTILQRWAEDGGPSARWYIESILIPGVSVFARLVFVAEVGAGIALFLGLWTRPVAILTFVMVLNIHFAHSSLFQYGFLSKGDGLPILCGLLAVAVAGKGIPFNLSDFGNRK